ncbi:MAG: hypothetical protein HYS13_25930 [Planctomycetia bacterium]|nr:hypothetical protein [Planctomycetia bacterium]
MRTKLIVVLVAVPVAAALSAAALAWASQLWAGIALTATIAILTLTTLGAVQRRTFCIGFAVFAWLYLLLVATSSLSEGQPSLPTTRAVVALQGTAAKPENGDAELVLSVRDRTLASAQYVSARLTLLLDSSVRRPRALAFSPDGKLVATGARLRLAPGGERAAPLVVIGQALWTIVLGLVGGGAAWSIRRIDGWLARRQSQSKAEVPPC